MANSPHTHVQYMVDHDQIATGTGNGRKALVSSTGSKTLTGARSVDDIGKQTRSDPMETARPGKSQSDSAES